MLQAPFKTIKVQDVRQAMTQNQEHKQYIYQLSSKGQLKAEGLNMSSSTKARVLSTTKKGFDCGRL